MSLRLKKSRIAEILSLIVLSVITILAIINKQVSVFYIIYLFWFDELLKTIFDFLKNRFQRENSPNTQNNKSLIRTRFFMLGIYIVFIITCFGVMFDWASSDIVIGNFEIVFFKNEWFNITVIGLLFREIAQYYYEDAATQPVAHNVASKGMITLHLSIIIGVLLWFFVSKTWDNDILNLSSYSSVFAILPFVIIKFVLEIMEINDRHKSVNTSTTIE